MIPIVLVGLPGSGKSTVGRLLARRLQLSFVDTDQLIEKRLGMPIRDFFADKGEEAFRDVEAAVMVECCGAASAGSTVVSTGGGAVLRASNRELLRSLDTVIYLRASPDEIARRLRHDTSRPLLQGGDALGRLRELHALRDPLYREVADFTVENGRRSVSMLLGVVLMQLELAGKVQLAPDTAAL